MVLHQESSDLLDIVNFSKDRHTAENIKKEEATIEPTTTE